METLDRLIDNLMDQQWVQTQDYIPTELVHEIAEEVRSFETSGKMRTAAIGQGDDQHNNDTVRQTLIAWLDPENLTTTQQKWYDFIQTTIQRLNETCYLSLVDFECHYAVYPPGAFYERHLDQFRGDTRRTISFTLYLNEDWNQEDGGALRLYLESGDGNETFVDVWPNNGTFSMFLSSALEHEVLPTQRTRYAVIGWMKTRGSRLI